MVLMLAVTIYVILKNNELNDIINVMKQGNPLYIIMGLAVMLISLSCESLIFLILFRFLGEKIKFRRCLKYTFLGFYYAGITPSASGGQPAQIYYMSRDGYRFTSSSIVILVVVIIYKLVLIGLIGLMALLDSSFAFSNIGIVKWFFLFGFLVNLVCILLYIMIFVSSNLLKKVIIRFIDFFAGIKIIRHKERKIDKIVELIDDYKSGTGFIRNNLIIILPVFIITLIQRVLLFSIPYIVYRYFGMNELSYLDILTIQIILNTAVDNLPVPGGVGVSELAFQLLYKVVYSEAMIVPAMLLTRFINFYIMLVISAAVAMTAHILSLKKRIVIKSQKTKGERS